MKVDQQGCGLGDAFAYIASAAKDQAEVAAMFEAVSNFNQGEK